MRIETTTLTDKIATVLRYVAQVTLNQHAESRQSHSQYKVIPACAGITEKPGFFDIRMFSCSIQRHHRVDPGGGEYFASLTTNCLIF
jgi:hypothetical protein